MVFESGEPLREQPQEKKGLSPKQAAVAIGAAAAATIVATGHTEDAIDIGGQAVVRSVEQVDKGIGNAREAVEKHFSDPRIGQVRKDGKQYAEFNGQLREVGDYVYSNVSIVSAKEQKDSTDTINPFMFSGLRSDRHVVDSEELKQIHIDFSDPNLRLKGKKVYGPTYNGVITLPDGSMKNVGQVDENSDGKELGYYFQVLDEDSNVIGYVPEIFVNYSQDPQDRIIMLTVGD